MIANVVFGIGMVALAILVTWRISRWRRDDGDDFVPGQRVRIVRMNVAVRSDVRGGTVVSLLHSTPYGSAQSLPFVRVVMDDDTIEEYVALRSFWTLHDGCLEYRC